MAGPTRSQIESAYRIRRQYQQRATRGNRGAQRQLVKWDEHVATLIEQLQEAAESGDPEAQRLSRIYAS